MREAITIPSCGHAFDVRITLGESEVTRLPDGGASVSFVFDPHDLRRLERIATGDLLCPRCTAEAI